MVRLPLIGLAARGPIRALFAGVVTLTSPVFVAADVIELKGGGEVVGVVVEKTPTGEHVVRTPDGVTLTVKRRDIARYVQEDPNLGVYRERARQTPDTAQAHRELAEWCHEKELFERRDHHYRRVLQLDPEDEQSRQELGYRRVGDQWLTRDQLLQSRGLRLYDGKYRTAQAIALRQQKGDVERSDNDWFKKLRLWCDWMASSRSDRTIEGQSRIAAIADPEAAPALARLLSREENPWIRQQLLATLGELNHSATTQTLVDLSLYSEDAEEARDALDYLMRLAIPRSVVPFVGALRSNDNEIVNRAAAALGKMGDAEAISPLIDSLETVHKYRSGDGPKFNPTFDGSGGGGFTMGGGPNIVEVAQQNVQVLQALSKLSGGQDFGYDERAWRHWYVNERARDRVDSRRDR